MTCYQCHGHDPTAPTTPPPRVCGLGCLLALLLILGPAAQAQEYRLEDGQWIQQTQPDPNTPEGEIHAIRALLAAGQAKKAIKQADAFIENRPNHPLLPEAYLLRGDAKAGRKDYYQALYDYEYVIRVFSGTDHYLTAVEREYEIARLFAAGMKRKLWGIRMVPADDEAEEIFIRIQERLPGSALGEKASMDLADFYFDRADMKMAAEAYDLFLLNYPRSAMRERALLRLIESSLATFKGPRFDSTGLLEAAERIRDFQAEFPAAANRIGAAALLVRVEESLALKALLDAQWFEQRGRHVGAAYSYRRIVTDHPDTDAARQALERLAAMNPMIVNEITQPAPSPEPEQTLELDAPAADPDAAPSGDTPILEPSP